MRAEAPAERTVSVARAGRRAWVARPRRDTIALTLPKNAIWIGALALAMFSLILVSIGVWIGRGTAEAPAPVSTSAVLAEVESPPVEAIDEAIDEPRAPPPPAKPKAKLDVRERVPNGKHGLQVGAFPTKGEARKFLEDHATEFQGMPMYMQFAKGSRGTRYRVRVGNFEDRDDAEKARSALPPDLSKASMVVKY